MNSELLEHRKCWTVLGDDSVDDEQGGKQV